MVTLGKTLYCNEDAAAVLLHPHYFFFTGCFRDQHLPFLSGSKKISELLSSAQEEEMKEKYQISEPEMTQEH